MRKCELFSKRGTNKGKTVSCIACEHRCVIASGKTGICAVRRNVDGVLFLTVYGKVISHHIDPIEKKPLFHFLPGTKTYSIGTFGCNFRCGFCQNYDISQAKESESFLEGDFGIEMTPDEIVRNAVKSGCKSISYTYNEPTVFLEFAKDIAIIAKKNKLKNIFVTNGYMTKEAFDFISPYIDAMNIDLKFASDKDYLKNCGAKMNPVLETIKRAHKKKIHIEITTLIIPEKNDSKKDLEKIAKFIASVDNKIAWHISRFFPMYKMLKTPATEFDTLVMAKEIGKNAGLKYVYIGNI